MLCWSLHKYLYQVCYLHFYLHNKKFVPCSNKISRFKIFNKHKITGVNKTKSSSFSNVSQSINQTLIWRGKFCYKELLSGKTCKLASGNYYLLISNHTHSKCTSDGPFTRSVNAFTRLVKP